MEPKGRKWAVAKVEDNPSLVWPTLGALVGALLTQFVPDIEDALLNAVVNAVVIIGPVLVGAVATWRQVTPLRNPKTEDGEPAVILPQSVYAQHVAMAYNGEKARRSDD